MVIISGSHIDSLFLVLDMHFVSSIEDSAKFTVRILFVEGERSIPTG